MRKFLFIILMLLFLTVPAMAQGDVVAGDSLPDWMIFTQDMSLIVLPALLVGMGIWFLGVSVPPGYIEKQKEAAKATETPVDDIVWAVLEKMNQIQAERMATKLEAGTPFKRFIALDEGYSTQNFDAVAVDVPTGWEYYYVLGGQTKEHVPVNTSEDGFLMNVSGADGNFGFEQKITLLAGQAYELAVDVIKPDSVTILMALFAGETAYIPEKVGDVWAIDAPPDTGDYTLRVYAYIKDVAPEDANVLWKSINLNEV